MRTIPIQIREMIRPSGQTGARDNSPKLKFTLPVNANDRLLPSINIFFMDPVNGVTSTMDSVWNTWGLRMSEEEKVGNTNGGAARTSIVRRTIPSRSSRTKLKRHERMALCICIQGETDLPKQLQLYLPRTM